MVRWRVKDKGGLELHLIIYEASDIIKGSLGLKNGENLLLLLLISLNSDPIFQPLSRCNGRESQLKVNSNVSD